MQEGTPVIRGEMPVIRAVFKSVENFIAFWGWLSGWIPRAASHTPPYPTVIPAEYQEENEM